MNQIIKQTKTSPLILGALIAAFVILFVAGRMLWIKASRPAHLKEIASAYGAVTLFSEKLQLNRDGSKFTYLATSDKGYGLFFYDADKNQKQIICDEHGIGTFGSISDIHAWPWSPDGSTFVYSAQDNLIVYVPDNPKASQQLTVGTNAVTDLVWLNPSTFAYLANKTNFCYAQKQSDGQWQPHELTQAKGITSLTAVDANTVAWLQDGLICRINVKEGAAGSANSAVAQDTDTRRPPTDGLKLWLDASTLQQADQTALPGMRDLSASENNAVPNGLPPIFNGPGSARALNGKGTIHFASTGSATNATGLKTRDPIGITGNAPRSVFAVMRHDPGKVMLINIGDYASRFGFFGVEEEDRLLYLPRIWNRFSNRIIYRSRNWNILGVIYDGASQSGYANGELVVTNNVRVDTVDNMVEIGRRVAGADGKNAAGADGDFAELLIYDRALDNKERQQVTGYLKSKWLANPDGAIQSPFVWCDPQISGVAGLAYDKQSGQFLLHQNGTLKDSLWRYDPGTGESSMIAEASAIKSPQWWGTNVCYYAHFNSGTNAILLADALGTKKTPLLACEDLYLFQAASDGGKLLMVGTFSNEPAMGIWQYDLAAEKLRSLVAYSDYPSGFVKKINPVRGPIKLASGRSVQCTIYAPPNLDPRKKYPLVIGDSYLRPADNGGDGHLWMENLAACGAYVVYIERPNWMGKIDKWGEDVMGVYKNLAQNHRVDTDRVFLFGISAETPYVSAFATNSPNLWKGIIFLSPIVLPDFSGSTRLRPMPKIIISIGGEEHRGDWLKQYQQKAIESGVMVETIIHSGERHYVLGNAALLERNRAFMRFIFEE